MNGLIKPLVIQQRPHIYIHLCFYLKPFTIVK